ncbi:MAG: AmmeMemoRadiSam system radical SAM enzyme [Thermodesulfobacteriota bacterium]
MEPGRREAMLYERQEDGKVRCLLCRHGCLIGPGKRGICGVRENRGGVLETLVYARAIARHIDPIEKKPLFHVLPGSLSYSIATAGCNFRCRFCQNSDISQMPADHDGLIAGQDYPPETVVRDALAAGCKSIAYTYTEPTVYFEYAYETAKLARQKGLKNVFVTNGYESDEAVALIAPYLDAANVDLKAFSEEFYREQAGAKLSRVQDTLRAMHKAGIFLEVTTLVIPGLNDHPGELKALAEFLARELSPAVPWHVSRFHPTYRCTDRPVTPVATLLAAREAGRSAGLHYVYTGNIPGRGGEDTLCHSCGALLIGRTGYTISAFRLGAGKCPQCGTPAAGIWS